MVAKKSKSKRQTLQTKYKIIKRVKQHEKKLKKGAIVNKHKKKSDDNRIPSQWPYKEQLLNEIQAAKDRAEAAKEEQKNKRQAEIAKRRNLNMAIGSSVKEDDAADEMESEEVVNDGSIELTARDGGQNSRRAFLKELRKVVDNSDVILHVLDARDPLGTRSNAIEEMVLSAANKKMIFILNKADLVPRDVLVSWLSFLRKSHPTLLFKSNTQTQSKNLGRMSGKVSKVEESALTNTSHAVGTEELLNILKNYARTGGSGGNDQKTNKATISVGIVGFPNVGKSSLINSLLRIRKVGVSSVPGFTRTYQEVILDKNIRLIDCPGIVFAEENDGNSAANALRNCVNVDEIADVYSPMGAILERCPQSYLMQLYSIPKFKSQDVMAFLSLVARATGKLKKGGIPNTDAVARSILHDWNTGKIKYYCKVPVDESGKAYTSLAQLTGSSTITAEEAESADAEAKIMSGFSASEFDINSTKRARRPSESDGMDMDMESPEEALLAQLGGDELCSYVAVDSSKPDMETENDEDIFADDDVAIRKKKDKKSSAAKNLAAVKDNAVATGSNSAGRTAEEIATSRKIKSIKQKESTKIISDDFQNATVMNNAIQNSRIQSTALKSGVVAENLRKTQKEEKKKAAKASRRAAESYDFDTDFDYSTK